MSPQRIVLIASCAAIALAGTSCASRTPTSSATISSAELSTRVAGEAAQLTTAGKYGKALELADRAVALAPENPWAHYDRATALHMLGRTPESVAAYRAAQTRFGDSDEERWGKSVAIYGRARALDDAGSCDEARAAYAEFADLVRSSSPRAAEMAQSYARQCGTAGVTRVTSAVSTAVVAQEYERALTEADRTLASPSNMSPDPWLEYNRAVALAELGRTNEAVESFKAAEAWFGNDERARSLAVYGRARALDNAGRCVAARKAYDEYARIAPSPADADYARSVGQRCGDLYELPPDLRRR